MLTGRTPSRRPAWRPLRAAGLPLLLTAVALLALATAVRTASAHANLVRSDPASGAILKAAPAQIQLWFSEQPDPHFSSVQVLDDQRQRVDAGDMHVAPGDPLSLIVSVKPNLPDALYTVSWKTVSAVDGHVVNGNFPFYIGQPPSGTVLPAASQAGPTSSGSTPTPGTVLVRWFSLLSAVVLLGGFVFWPLVLLPSLRAAAAPAPGPGAMAAQVAPAEPVSGIPRAAAERAEMLLIGAWVVLVLAGIAAVVQQAAAVSGAGVLHLVGAPLRTLLFDTRYGRTWWLRAAATLGTGGVLLARGRATPSGRRALVMSVLGALAVEAVLLSYSLNSHAAALQSGVVLATASDLLHVTVVGLWIGGLVQLAALTPLVLRELDAGERVRYLASAVPRFSTMALASVAILAATGIYQAVRQMSGWNALWETGWGRTLDVKLLLLVPLLLLGAVNLLVVRPALARAATGGTGGAAASSLRGLARIERGFVGAVAAESVLGVAILLVVGILVNQPPPQVVSAAATPGIHLTSKAEGVTVKLTITPGQLGPNHFEATVDVHGKPPPDGTQLVFRLTFQDADLGTTELVTRPEGKGHYGADTSDLSTYGHWQILALVQPPAADEVRTDFSMALTNAGSTGSGTEAKGDTSVKKGEQLYMANCAECHGADAHGDGPLAKQLNPPPVDLIVHVPQHEDSQLLDWIANGIPATAMPAFGGKLNAQDREAILNYLRNLTRDATPTSATPAPAATP